ncbi:MAG: helix-turn-helix domain-containing protein [Pseudomonadota bacterium]|nr:helix-turn-helix domain-containing protein [Pseudomonadota bacterium]
MSIEAMTRVWKESKATGTALVVLLALADHANDDFVAWPSIATLSTRARVDRRSVIRTLQKLVDMGELKVVGEGIRGVKKYRLTSDASVTRDADVTGDTDVTPTSDASVTSTSDASVTRTLTKPTLEPSINKSDRFDEFWSAYPKRVAKGQARKAWDRLVKTNDPEQIIAGAKRYALDQSEQDIKFIRHPATWLNGEGWLDETVAASLSPVDFEKAQASRRRVEASLQSKAKQVLSGEITNLAKIGSLLNDGYLVRTRDGYAPGPRMSDGA